MWCFFDIEDIIVLCIGYLLSLWWYGVEYFDIICIRKKVN